MNPVLLLIFVLFINNPGNRQSLKSAISLFLFPSWDIKRHAVPRMPKPPNLLPSYIDTFKMELLVDRLHNMTNALEKINRLNQSKKIHGMNKPSDFAQIERIKDSLDAINGLLGDDKPAAKHINTLADTISSIEKLGDLERTISAFAPLLSTFFNTDKTT